MKIVIDANRIIAAIIKDSTTRKILFDRDLEFIAPEYMISEIYKYRAEIQKKAKLTEQEFEVVLALIFENITIVPKSEYENLLRIARMKSLM